jgi:hypothetical protein
LDLPYQGVSGLSFHKGQQGFILLGFGTDDGVNLPVAKFFPIIDALGTAINAVTQDLLVLPNDTSFGLAPEFEGQVVVLNPEEAKVDVIVDGLGAKGFGEE